MYEDFLERIAVVSTRSSKGFSKPLIDKLRQLDYKCIQYNIRNTALGRVSMFEPHMIFVWWEPKGHGEDIMTLRRSEGCPIVAVASAGAIQEVVTFCQRMDHPNQLLGFLSHPIDDVALASILHSAAHHNWIVQTESSMF